MTYTQTTCPNRIACPAEGGALARVFEKNGYLIIILIIRLHTVKWFQVSLSIIDITHSFSQSSMISSIVMYYQQFNQVLVICSQRVLFEPYMGPLQVLKFWIRK